LLFDPQELVNKQEALHFARRRGFAAYVECSAKTGAGVEKVNGSLSIYAQQIRALELKR
jgi:Ras family